MSQLVSPVRKVVKKVVVRAKGDISAADSSKTVAPKAEIDPLIPLGQYVLNNESCHLFSSTYSLNQNYLLSQLYRTTSIEHIQCIAFSAQYIIISHTTSSKEDINADNVPNISKSTTHIHIYCCKEITAGLDIDLVARFFVDFKNISKMQAFQNQFTLFITLFNDQSTSLISFPLPNTDKSAQIALISQKTPQTSQTSQTSQIQLLNLNPTPFSFITHLNPPSLDQPDSITDITSSTPTTLPSPLNAQTMTATFTLAIPNSNIICILSGTVCGRLWLRFIQTYPQTSDLSHKLKSDSNDAAMVLLQLVELVHFDSYVSQISPLHLSSSIYHNSQYLPSEFIISTKERAYIISLNLILLITFFSPFQSTSQDLHYPLKTIPPPFFTIQPVGSQLRQDYMGVCAQPTISSFSPSFDSTSHIPLTTSFLCSRPGRRLWIAEANIKHHNTNINDDTTTTFHPAQIDIAVKSTLKLTMPLFSTLPLAYFTTIPAPLTHALKTFEQDTFQNEQKDPPLLLRSNFNTSTLPTALKTQSQINYQNSMNMPLHFHELYSSPSLIVGVTHGIGFVLNPSSSSLPSSSTSSQTSTTSSLTLNDTTVPAKYDGTCSVLCIIDVNKVIVTEMISFGMIYEVSIHDTTIMFLHTLEPYIPTLQNQPSLQPLSSSQHSEPAFSSSISHSNTDSTPIQHKTTSVLSMISFLPTPQFTSAVQNYIQYSFPGLKRYPIKLSQLEAIKITDPVLQQRLLYPQVPLSYHVTNATRNTTSTIARINSKSLLDIIHSIGNTSSQLLFNSSCIGTGFGSKDTKDIKNHRDCVISLLPPCTSATALTNYTHAHQQQSDENDTLSAYLVLISQFQLLYQPASNPFYIHLQELQKRIILSQHQCSTRQDETTSITHSNECGQLSAILNNDLIEVESIIRSLEVYKLLYPIAGNLIDFALSAKNFNTLYDLTKSLLLQFTTLISTLRNKENELELEEKLRIESQIAFEAAERVRKEEEKLKNDEDEKRKKKSEERQSRQEKLKQLKIEQALELKKQREDEAAAKMQKEIEMKAAYEVKLIEEALEAARLKQIEVEQREKERLEEEETEKRRKEEEEARCLELERIATAIEIKKKVDLEASILAKAAALKDTEQNAIIKAAKAELDKITADKNASEKAAAAAQRDAHFKLKKDQEAKEKQDKLDTDAAVKKLQSDTLSTKKKAEIDLALKKKETAQVVHTALPIAAAAAVAVAKQVELSPNSNILNAGDSNSPQMSKFPTQPVAARFPLATLPSQQSSSYTDPYTTPSPELLLDYQEIADYEEKVTKKFRKAKKIKIATILDSDDFADVISDRQYKMSLDDQNDMILTTENDPMIDKGSGNGKKVKPKGKGKKDVIFSSKIDTIVEELNSNMTHDTYNVTLSGNDPKKNSKMNDSESLSESKKNYFPSALLAPLEIPSQYSTVLLNPPSTMSDFAIYSNTHQISSLLDYTTSTLQSANTIAPSQQYKSTFALPPSTINLLHTIFHFTPYVSANSLPANPDPVQSITHTCTLEETILLHASFSQKSTTSTVTPDTFIQTFIQTDATSTLLISLLSYLTESIYELCVYHNIENIPQHIPISLTTNKESPQISTTITTISSINFSLLTTSTDYITTINLILPALLTNLAFKTAHAPNSSQLLKSFNLINANANNKFQFSPFTHVLDDDTPSNIDSANLIQQFHDTIITLLPYLSIALLTTTLSPFPSTTVLTIMPIASFIQNVAFYFSHICFLNDFSHNLPSQFSNIFDSTLLLSSSLKKKASPSKQPSNYHSAVILMSHWFGQLNSIIFALTFPQKHPRSFYEHLYMILYSISQAYIPHFLSTASNTISNSFQDQDQVQHQANKMEDIPTLVPYLHAFIPFIYSTISLTIFLLQTHHNHIHIFNQSLNSYSHINTPHNLNHNSTSTTTTTTTPPFSQYFEPSSNTSSPCHKFENQKLHPIVQLSAFMALFQVNIKPHRVKHLFIPTQSKSFSTLLTPMIEFNSTILDQIVHGPHNIQYHKCSSQLSQQPSLFTFIIQLIIHCLYTQPQFDTCITLFYDFLLKQQHTTQHPNPHDLHNSDVKPLLQTPPVLSSSSLIATQLFAMLHLSATLYIDVGHSLALVNTISQIPSYEIFPITTNTYLQTLYTLQHNLDEVIFPASIMLPIVESISKLVHPFVRSKLRFQPSPQPSMPSLLQTRKFSQAIHHLMDLFIPQVTSNNPTNVTDVNIPQLYSVLQQHSLDTLSHEFTLPSSDAQINQNTPGNHLAQLQFGSTSTALYK